VEGKDVGESVTEALLEKRTYDEKDRPLNPESGKEKGGRRSQSGN